MWTETQGSRGERFIGEEMSMKDKGEWTGRAFRLGCRHGTREGGEAGRKVIKQEPQAADNRRLSGTRWYSLWVTFLWAYQVAQW